jgi:lipopolysaccharide export system permease protein
MMKLYVSYIIRNLLGPLLVVTFSLTGIIWLTQSLRFIDLIVNRGLDVSTFLYISSLLIPSLMLIIIPIALFCSVIYIYHKFIIDSELIIIKSAGLSRLSIAKPALMVAIFAMMLGYLFSLYLLPASYREFKDTQAFIRDNYASVLLQEGVFNHPTAGLTVYVESRAKNGMLEGILVHDARDEKKPSTMMAQKGTLTRKSSGSGASFYLVNGNRQEVDQNGNLSVLYFDSYPLDLSVYTKESGFRAREAEERYLDELLNPGKVSDKMRRKFYAEAHHRITWPVYNVILTLLALAALLSGQFNRRGQWKRIIAATLCSIISVASHLGIKSLVASQPHFVFLMYTNIITFIVLAFYVLRSHHIIEFSWPRLRRSSKGAS